jgi:hypothetical protein
MLYTAYISRDHLHEYFKKENWRTNYTQDDEVCKEGKHELLKKREQIYKQIRNPLRLRCLLWHLEVMIPFISANLFQQAKCYDLKFIPTNCKGVLILLSLYNR